MPQPLTFLGRVPPRETSGDDYEYRVMALNAVVDPLCSGVSRQFFPFMQVDVMTSLFTSDTIILGDSVLGLSELTKRIALHLVDEGHAVVYDACGISVLMFGTGEAAPDDTLEKCGYAGRALPAIYELMGHDALRTELLMDVRVTNVYDLTHPPGHVPEYELIYAEPRANYAVFTCWPEAVQTPGDVALYEVPAWEQDEDGKWI